MSEKALLPCIHLAQGDIPPRVLVCGDPARAERISKRLTEARCLARDREYWTYTGLYQGVPVAVVSHGVGSGGAAIAFESLWRAGARVIIRVGDLRRDAAGGHGGQHRGRHCGLPGGGRHGENGAPFLSGGGRR